MHVLVIDDDRGTCDTLSLGLRRLGSHDVTTALTARRGLDEAAKRVFQVVVIDQYLGSTVAGETGLDVLTGLSGTISAGATKYVYTAYGSVEDAVTSLKAGAASYLRKETCDIVELNDLISIMNTHPGNDVHDPRIRAVMQLMSHRPDVACDDLACSVNLSVSRLRHLFLEQSHLPLGAYQKEVRLHRAASLLGHSFLTIKQISQQMGWSDERSFRHAFHARFGCTPTEYRAAGLAPRIAIIPPL